MTTEMSSPTMSSIYEPSSPGSLSALSIDSDASDTPDSPYSNRSASPSLVANGLVYPPLSLSALVAASEKGTYLDNPFPAPTFDKAWNALFIASPEEASDLLGMYISTIVKDADNANMISVAAKADESIKRSVVERYAEFLVAAESDAKQGRSKVDFIPYQRAVDLLLTQSGDTFETGQMLAARLATEIETYAFLCPKGAAYPTRKGALSSLVSLGEGVMAAPSELRRGITTGRQVGGKLGLALAQVFGQAGGQLGESKGREMGYMKRDGLAGRAKALVGRWEEVAGEGSMGETEWVGML